MSTGLSTSDGRLNTLGGSTAANLGGGAAFDPATGNVSAPAFTTYNNDGTTGVANNVGDALTAINNAGTKYVQVQSTGPAAQAAAGKSVAIGGGAVASVANSVALGEGSTTAAAVPTADFTLQGSPYAFAGAAPVGVVSVGSAGAERQIQNVAAGQLSATSTDAVNGSQLFATNQALNAIAGGGGVKYFHANSTGPDSLASGAESVAAGPQAVSGGAGSVAVGQSANSAGAGSLAVGQAANSAGDGSLAVGQAANSAGVGSLAVGQAANSAGASAVAFGQNTQATGASAVAVGQGAQASGANAVAVGPGAKAATNGTAVGFGAVVQQAGGVAIGARSVASTGPGAAGYVPPGATAEQTAAINATTSTQAGVSVGDAANGQYRQINGVAAGTAPSDATNVSQLQATAAQVKAGGVQYTTNPDGSTNYNEVKLGAGQAPNGTRITNVAPGVFANDAVNVGQLNQLRGDIRDVGKVAYSGVAMGFAMAGTYLPTLYPGEKTVGIGVGYYYGYSAVALTFKALSDDGKMSWGAGVSTTGQQWGVNAGIGWKWK